MGDCCKEDGARTCSCETGANHHSHDHWPEPGGSGEESRLRLLLACGLLLFAAGLVADWAFDSEASVILFALAYLSVGWNVARQVLDDFRDGQFFTENLLMTVASVGAFAIGEHAEGAAVMVFYTLGEVLQSLAVRRSRESIKASMDLRPDRARAIRGGSEVELGP
ncbi:MAG TPA: heavy metal translocating P-type ATPase, partial [Bacillota bacterium]|nr:heavy metal translocating P-type ATPase [Bacillota bacterium]